MERVGIVATREEQVSSLLNSLEELSSCEYSGHNFYTGNLGNVKVAVGISDVGKVNAAIVSEILSLVYDVDAVISVGTAGTLTTRICIFDMVLSDSVTYHDVDRLQMNSHQPHCEYFYSDKGLINKAVETYKKISPKYNIYHGRCITGDIFVADDELKFIIENEYKADCVDMEGAAVAHTAYVNSIPFIILRWICNSADDDTSVLYNATDEKCEENITDFIVEYLKMLTENNL